MKCFSVTGYSGGSVLVDSGKLWFSDSVKYMYKLYEWKTIIDYAKHGKWINEGHFTLFCDSKGYLVIFIREINKGDAGIYRIIVNNQWSIDMTLNVKEGQSFQNTILCSKTTDNMYICILNNFIFLTCIVISLLHELQMHVVMCRKE